MATTTPNYGWAVPTSTDLVKDGATAIETLGDAIDASMNTALGTKKAGMVLLNTTSFSGVASQSFNNVFSATYESYKIIAQLTISTGSNIFIKLRASGTDSSTGYLGNSVYTYSNSSTITVTNSNNTATGLLIDAYSPSILNLDFVKPFLAEKTIMTGMAAGFTSDPRVIGGFDTLVHNVSTSYDGFTLINAGAATITGKVSVYGYNF
jgi:hypothetical protein